MSTTPQQILNGAYGKSTKNQPGTIATEATELLAVVTRALRGLYAAAARVSPSFFGIVVTVPKDAGTSSWPRPTDAESVFRAELPDGSPVAIVPFDDRTVESALPSIYPMGSSYYPAGLPTDPAGDLRLYYSKLPDAPAGLATTIDGTWPEQFNELLILETAIYLATKDGGSGRESELQVLLQDRNRWLALFVAHLEHATAGMQRRWALRPTDLQGLMPLLAGAAAQG